MNIIKENEVAISNQKIDVVFENEDLIISLSNPERKLGFYALIAGKYHPLSKDERLKKTTHLEANTVLEQTFSERMTSIYLIETLLGQYIAYKVKAEKQLNRKNNYHLLNDHLLLLVNEEGAFVLNNPSLVKLLQIERLTESYIKKGIFYEKTEDILLADTKYGNYQLFLKEEQNFTPLKVETSWNEEYIIQQQGRMYLVKQGSIFLHHDYNNFDEVLIEKVIATEDNIEICTSLFDKIYLEDEQQTKQIFMEESESGSFILDVAKEEVEIAKIYSFLGLKDEQPYRIDFSIQGLGDLTKGTFVSYQGKPQFITTSFSEYCQSHYQIEIQGTVFAKTLQVENQHLMLCTPERWSHFSHVVFKKDEQLTFRKMQSKAEQTYMCELPKHFHNELQVGQTIIDVYLGYIEKDKLTLFRLLLEKETDGSRYPYLFEEKENSKKAFYINETNEVKILVADIEEYYTFFAGARKEKITFSSVELVDDRLSLTFPYSIQNTKGIKLTVTDRKTEESITLELLEASEYALTWSITELTTWQKGKATRLDLYLSIEFEDNNYYQKSKLVLDREIKRKEGLIIKKYNNENCLLLYVTNGNTLCMVFNKHVAVLREYYQVQTKFISFKRKNKQTYRVKLTFESLQELNIKAAFIQLRNNEYQKQIFGDIVNQKGKVIVIDLTMDWSSFYPLFWDFYLEVEGKAYSGSVKVKGTSKDVLKKVKADYLALSLFDDKSHIIYPYVTFSNDIAFMVREKEKYEVVNIKHKDNFAYFIYKLFKSYFDKKEIWLSFEKFSQTAQDNGFAFFKYVQDNNLHPSHYYVLSRNSKDFDRIEKNYKNIVPHMSFKYFILLYASKLLVSSETPRHVHNIRVRSGRAAEAIQKKQSVFLQHGVTAFKQSDVFKKAKGRGNFDLVIATSDQEKEIIHNNWLYDYDEIAVTGFSRWDLLKDKSQSLMRKRIFVMPTWRSWMEEIPKEDFIQSDYFINYSEFLSSEDLLSLLDKHNLDLVFFLHPKFKTYISEFRQIHPRVHLYAFGDIQVNEMIMESSLMVSDYSSVTWDMFYMGKPVIFFQFDYEKYEEYEGSYIDMETNLFGDRVMDIEMLLAAIKKAIHNDFQLANHYQEIRRNYFKYLDDKNSLRIYQVIREGDFNEL